jgi:PAB-dependent poly(A)-specific ribonuclease subunit 2
MVFEVGAPAQKIDTAILNSMTRTDMGFFAKNPRTKRRYQIEDTRQNDRAADSLTAPKFLSEKARAAQTARDMDSETAETMEILTDMHLDDVTKKEVPAMYGNVEIKYSKFGVDDFDFAYVLPFPRNCCT